MDAGAQNEEPTFDEALVMELLRRAAQVGELLRRLPSAVALLLLAGAAEVLDVGHDLWRACGAGALCRQRGQSENGSQMAGAGQTPLTGSHTASRRVKKRSTGSVCASSHTTGARKADLLRVV